VKRKSFFLTNSAVFLLFVVTPWLSLNPARAQIQSPTEPKAFRGGDRISLNGRILPAAWQQQPVRSVTNELRTAISDLGLMQLLGVELLNTQDATKQPLRWFANPNTPPLVSSTWHSGSYRYLDVSQLATKVGWQMRSEGDILRITTPAAKITGLRQGKQTWGDRLVVDLDRPTPWQLTQKPPAPKPKAPVVELPDDPRQQLPSQAISTLSRPYQQWAIAIDAGTNPGLIQQLNADLAVQLPKQSQISPSPLVKLGTTANLTTINLSLPVGILPRVSTLSQPNRIIIDLRPDPLVERDILWARGLRWQQRYINLGRDRFPVTWLEVNPRTAGLALRPILSQVQTLVGTAPILTTAQRYAAAAAINAGFFNRNNKLPLGAIRRDGRWLSSPILNRGAIAWNDAGQFKIGRLQRQETAIASTGQSLPIANLNSGYIQAGISRYTSDWGTTYTPLANNEGIAVVQNNQVTAYLPGGLAGKTAFPIPLNGYLLVFRTGSTANLLPVGAILRLTDGTLPAEFANYPHAIGAGPLLVQNRQIVLNAKAEGFSDAFSRQTAVRSAIGVTATGNLLIATVHNRVDGTGPTLWETAKIVQQLGSVNALNLDGGSSTSLYLGGQLVNRSPATAARVHNGFGVFLESEQ
jgi:Phosphodiester glycosidase